MYVCNYICLTVVLYDPESRTSPEFQKLLGIAMEMFLLCSDDSESDVRMVADECLNKIIKVSRNLLTLCQAPFNIIHISVNRTEQYRRVVFCFLIIHDAQNACSLYLSSGAYRLQPA